MRSVCRIRNYTADIMPESQTKLELQKAFRVWSDVSQLTFTELSVDKADIEIFFYSGDHGDSRSFNEIGFLTYSSG